MKFSAHRLLVVAGTSPGIITEAFYQLRIVEQKPVGEIFIITSPVGNRLIQQELMGEHGAFAALCAEYGPKHGFSRKDIRFDSSSITVAHDEAEHLFDNRKTHADEEVQYFHDRLMTLVAELTEDADSTLYACLSGGRRTMSFYLGVAMMLFGRPQDELIHVLVAEELQKARNPAFYYPTRKVKAFSKALVHAPRLSFLRFRNRLGKMHQGVSYGTLVKLFQQEVDQLPASAEEAWPGLFPQSKKMQRVLRECNRKFPEEIALIIGETGTGKELLARYIHHFFRGRELPFETVDLGSLHHEQIESTLFGHVRGAFTGANQSRRSAFQLAGKGTLLLDEVHALTPNQQDKLLRVLQKRVYRPLGGEKELEAECQIVIATNRNLKQMMEDGNFKEDLYYRISAFTYHLPPLRDREVDIIPLAEWFMREINEAQSMNYSGMDEAFKEFLLYNPWPGNVRYLQNVIKHAMSVGNGVQLRYDDLSEQYRSDAEHELSPLDRHSAEKISSVLDDCNGNVRETARLLGINYNTLISRIAKLGIDATRYRRK